MWKSLLLTLILFIPNQTTTPESDLLKAVIKDQSLIVSARPLDLILREVEAGTYLEHLKVFHKFVPEEGLIDELIKNASNQKPKNWKDEELPNHIVWQRDTKIKAKDALKKLQPESSDEKTSMKKFFKTFNDANNRRKPLFVVRLSRPVYSNDKTYAVAGTAVNAGGNISLFHLENDIWVWKGILKKWKF